MSETKETFSIDKPGAYKLRGGGIADIVEVNHKSAFGWLRSDTTPMSMRRWDRTGIADAGCQDIIEAIPFVVDGPGRYMMRNGRVAKVGIIAPAGQASQPVRGMDGLAKRTWHLDGCWGTEHHKSSYDLVRKMHPLEQDPVTKAPEAPKAPETKAPLDKPVFRITDPGVYCTRNGRVVNIHEVTSTTAHGHWKVSGNKREWPLNGRTHAAIDLGSDIVMKAPPADSVLKITDVVTRLRTDWDRRLAEQEEQSRKKSMGTKTPETPKTLPTLHDVVQGIEGKPTQHPSEEQLKLAYTEPPKPVTAKKPTVAITETGKYRARNGGIVTITSVYSNGAMGFTEYDGDISGWQLDGQYNEHCEDGNDIVEKIKMSTYEGASGKWTKEERDLLGAATGEPKKPSAESQAAFVKEWIGGEPMDVLKAVKQMATSTKPSNPEFDLVMVQGHGSVPPVMVAGIYSVDNGAVTLLPVGYGIQYVDKICSEFPASFNIMILDNGDRFTCPAHNVAYVIHCGGEE